MDPDMRRMAMFAAGIAAALAVLIVISLATGHHGSAVPIVTADSRPIRVKPDNPGGMKIDGAENDVFSGGTDTAEAALAPPAEVPDTKALRAGAPPAVAAALPSPPLPPLAYRSVVVSPALAKPSAVTPVSAPAKPGPVAEPPPAKQVSVAANAAPKSVAANAAPKSVAANAAPKSVAANAAPASIAANDEPKSVKAVAAPKVVVEPEPLPARPYTVAAAAKADPAEPASAAANPAPQAAGGATGRTIVQLAAVGSEDGARNEWQRLSRKMPDLLGGRQPTYTKTERDGRIFWRVRTTGFADAAQAKAFCEQLRAKGAACSVADF
jgi:hypothetical protein